MAEAIVQEATPKKVAFMTKPKNVEERIKKDEKELEKLLEEQKEDAKQDTESKTETDDTTEPDSAEERSFKKRYGDLRRHQQSQQKEFESKTKAFKFYKSEVMNFPHPRSIKAIENLAIQRGIESGLKKAESFNLIKMIQN